MELVYHIPSSSEGTESIFDKTIKNNFKGKTIKIMSPYLSLSYLKRLDRLSLAKWKLITDVNALLSSTNKHNYNALLEFINANASKIHHQSSLHAKTIISKDCAFLGSANFTESGIKYNNELSVLFTDHDKVLELNDWFDSWWLASNKLYPEKIRIPSPTASTDHNESHVFYLDNANGIRKVIVYDDKEDIKSILSEEEVIDYLLNWESIDFVNSSLDFIRDILNNFELESSDERFVLTLTIRNGKPSINFTVGQRYVFVPHYEKDGERYIGIIQPLDLDLDNIDSNIIHPNSINQILKGEGFSSKKGVIEAYWLVLKTSDTININSVTKEKLYKSIEIELNRAKKSSFRKHHQFSIFNLAVDNLTRNELLRKRKK